MRGDTDATSAGLAAHVRVEAFRFRLEIQIPSAPLPPPRRRIGHVHVARASLVLDEIVDDGAVLGMEERAGDVQELR